MKLTKTQAQKFADNYNLGKIKTLKLFNEGLVNYNYKIKTEKGIFVIRISGRDMDDFTKKKLALEKKVLFFLHKQNFPYEIPLPLKNKNKKVMSRTRKFHYWVYPFIEGKNIWEPNDKDFN